MGPLEQQLHQEYTEVHGRLWRPAWHRPELQELPPPPKPKRTRLRDPIISLTELRWLRPDPKAPRPPVPRPRIGVIQPLVARYYDLTPLDLLAQRRFKRVVYARHVAMYVVSRFTLKSLPEIGRHFGKRDHTTVLYAVNKIEAQRHTDAQLAAELRDLRRIICSATGWCEDEAP